MTVGGFGLEDIYVTFNLNSTNPQSFELGFGAKIPLLPGVMIQAAGKITPTQVYVSVSSTINWGSFAVLAEGTVYLGAANGSTTFTASVIISATILDQSLRASLVISTDASGAHYSVEYFVPFIPFGIVKLSLFADCDWAGFPGAAIIGARISGYVNLGVASGSFVGMASLGSDGDGKPTLLVDITATVTLGITWVANVAATVHFTNCQSRCTRYATPIFQLRASTTWLGNTVDTGWQTVSLDGTFSISTSSSFSRYSGVVYGCASCSDPGSAGLLRWQAWFSGSASFNFTERGLTVTTTAKAEVQESASKGTCTKRDSVGTCWGWDYSWGSFVKKIDVDISINSDSLRSSWLGKAFSA
jgi:hypothetical protein